MNYYPEPGELRSFYGGCGIHNHTNRHEFDYCPQCLSDDLIVARKQRLAEDEFLAQLQEEEY
jgi:hypothetical protein